MGEPEGPSPPTGLRHYYWRPETTITVVDQNNEHVYQPGLLFIPFGLAHDDEIVLRPRQRQLKKGIDFVQQAIDSCRP